LLSKSKRKERRDEKKKGTFIQQLKVHSRKEAQEGNSTVLLLQERTARKKDNS
jgi:hypothetical protein